MKWIELDPKGKPALVYSVPTIKASSFWNAGYTGGPNDIGVVDSGVDTGHAALKAHPKVKRLPGYISAHGTKVAGIVASTDSQYRGVAWGLDTIFDAAYNGNWYDAKAAMTWALTQTPDAADVLVHSWAFPREGTSNDWTMSPGDPDYSWMGYDLDQVQNSYLRVVAQSAGNEGPGQYTLSYPSDSYNAIVVAASNDGNDTNRSNDAIWSNSGRGPTPWGRKKPDLTAPGYDIFTTTFGNPPWAADSGTSLAAPHVAGALLLSWSHGMWHPALTKAWLINSAEDKGSSGWDAEWGWGYIDLQVGLDQYPYVMVGNINPSTNYWYSGTLSAGEKVTIVWLIHPGSSPATTALSDLDLYLYDANTGVELARSSSVKDNVEQVVLSSGSNRSVYVRVRNWSVSTAETYGFAPSRSFQTTSAPPWWTGGAPAAVAFGGEKKTFALYHNYPNPFNPETWIPYQLASEADVVVHIYDVKGQQVRTLNLGKQPAGSYVEKDRAAQWDGKNDERSSVASGIYFYTLEANGNKIGTYKMILQK